jgi:hypothetical protein
LKPIGLPRSSLYQFSRDGARFRDRCSASVHQTAKLPQRRFHGAPMNLCRRNLPQLPTSKSSRSANRSTRRPAGPGHRGDHRRHRADFIAMCGFGGIRRWPAPQAPPRKLTNRRRQRYETSGCFLLIVMGSAIRHSEAKHLVLAIHQRAQLPGRRRLPEVLFLGDIGFHHDHTCRAAPRSDGSIPATANRNINSRLVINQ